MLAQRWHLGPHSARFGPAPGRNACVLCPEAAAEPVPNPGSIRPEPPEVWSSPTRPIEAAPHCAELAPTKSSRARPQADRDLHTSLLDTARNAATTRCASPSRARKKGEHGDDKRRSNGPPRTELGTLPTRRRSAICVAPSCRKASSTTWRATGGPDLHLPTPRAAPRTVTAVGARMRAAFGRFRANAGQSHPKIGLLHAELSRSRADIHQSSRQVVEPTHTPARDPEPPGAAPRTVATATTAATPRDWAAAPPPAAARRSAAWRPVASRAAACLAQRGSRRYGRGRGAAAQRPRAPGPGGRTAPARGVGGDAGAAVLASARPSLSDARPCLAPEVGEARPDARLHAPRMPALVEARVELSAGQPSRPPSTAQMASAVWDDNYRLAAHPGPNRRSNRRKPSAYARPTLQRRRAARRSPASRAQGPPKPFPTSSSGGRPAERQCLAKRAEA